MSKKKSPAPRGTGKNSYSRSPNMKLPENYVICDGFLCKGNMPASLVTSGIVEDAIHGFLHVDEAGEYKTG